MALFVPPGHAQCVLSFSVGGSARPLAITLGVDHPQAADAVTVASSVYAAFTTQTAPFHATNMYAEWTFLGVDSFLGPIGGPDFDGNSGPVGSYRIPITGSNAGTGVPVNSAVLVRKNTASGGRRNRGRMFLPPCNIVEGAVSVLGVIDGGQVSGIQGKMNQAYTNLTTAGMVPVLFHGDEDPWYAPTLITSFSVQNLLATQRRRMR